MLFIKMCKCTSVVGSNHCHAYCISLKCHMTLSPSQTGLLRTSDCWSHFSAPPPGHWLYCGERPTYSTVGLNERAIREGMCVFICKYVHWSYHSESSALSSALSSSPSRITSLRATWDKKKTILTLRGQFWDLKQNRI